jgi:hypothetical protein
MGVVATIDCGQMNTCTCCYNTNEIFITPDLKIKPCHLSDYSIDLNPYLSKREDKNILEAICKSREFLFTRPGLEGISKKNLKGVVYEI